jgi:hypothetical protein
VMPGRYEAIGMEVGSCLDGLLPNLSITLLYLLDN